MENSTSQVNTLDVKKATKDILATVERDREREIVSRRFGLYDRKETLERIGDMLGITRERVRQLEKAVIARLKANAEEDKLPHIKDVERRLIMHLHEMGYVATISNITPRLFSGEVGEREEAHVVLLSELAPGITVVEENDNYNQAVAIKEHYDEKQIKAAVDEIVKIITKDIKHPATIEEIHSKTSLPHPANVHALATVSKKLAFLNGKWGSVKWPTVNPKNIRDKIYVILSETGKPMHFSDISKQIRQSDFKRKDVTTQAIHNELIKDKRFVLIGRGIYALSEWGYKRGTVADVIEEVLVKAGQPLHRDDIVKQVLKKREVKETTILLNLQGKPQFRRVAKATYTFDETKK